MHRYRFGDLLIDQEGFRLLQAGKPLAIEPKALNLLIYLVQHQGRLIERRELLGAIWGDAFVTDHVLNRSIGQLRKILGDDAKEPRYIETVPTLGYRFVAAVEMETQEASKANPERSDPAAEDDSCEKALPTPQVSASISRAEQSVVTDAVPPQLVLTQPSPVPETVQPRQRGDFIKRSWFYGIAFAAVITAIALFPRKPAMPAPLESTQITFSTEPKERPIFTDGSRLYFERRGQPSQMSVSGGAIVPMHAMGPGMHVRDISADGSKALGWLPDRNDENGVGSLWVGSTLGGASRKLGDNVGYTATWSPDGHSIVSSEGNVVSGMDDSGGHRRKLWSAPGPVTDLSFSPDGEQLCVTVEMPYVSRLWMLRSDGSQAHLLAVEWPANQDLRNGRWSPDGKHFIFRSDGEGRQNLYEVVKADWLHFWRMPNAVRITGNQIEILASAPSPDAKGLFVLGRLDQGAMQVLQPKSKTLSPYLNGFSAESFVVSPNRQWMAYSEYPSGNLWKSHLDGSGAVQLTDTPAYWQQWSPDGRSIVYSDLNKLYRVSAEGGPVERFDTGNYAVAPVWSPDGKSILFGYFDHIHEPEGTFVLDLATRRVSPLSGAESYYVASWSPDGRYLVAIARNPSRMMLYSAESKTWTVLKVLDVSWGLFAWSPDSKSICMGVVDGDRGIYRLGVPDGAWNKVVGLDDVETRDVEAFVSVTSDGLPVIMNHTGVAQFYFLRW